MSSAWLPRDPVGAAAGMNLTKNLVRDYGATGSSQYTYGTITAGSDQLSLSSAIDIVDGQPLVIVGAGTPPYVGAPPQPTATLVALPTSTTGHYPSGTTVRFAYAWNLDSGITEPCTAVTVTTTAANQGIQWELPTYPITATGFSVYTATGTNPLLYEDSFHLSTWTYSSNGFISTHGLQTGPYGFSGPYPASQQGAVGYAVTWGLPTSGAAAPSASNPSGAPNAPQITPLHTGTTTYSYYIVCIGEYGEYSQASAVATITNGSSGLSISNYNELSWSFFMNTAVAIYGASTNPAGSQGFLAATSTNRWLDFGQNVSPYTLYLQSPNYLPTSPPSTPGGGRLQATVVSGGGTTTLTLNTTAGSTVVSGQMGAGANVYHNDGVALNLALADLLANVHSPYGLVGGKLHVPAGYYWLDPSSVGYLDEWATGGGSINLCIEGEGENTILAPIPGCANKPLWGQTNNGNNFSNLTMQNLVMQGQAGNATPHLGFACNLSLSKFENVTWRGWFDGLSTGGSGYGGGGYMNQISNCNFYNNFHVACAVNSGFVTDSYFGSNGNNQPVANDSNPFNAVNLNLQTNLLCMGDITVAHCHLYAGYDNLILFGVGCIVQGNNFDMDAQRAVIRVTQGGSGQFIVGNVFSNSMVANTDYAVIHFINLNGAGSGNYIVSNVFNASPNYPYEYAVMCDNASSVDHNYLAANKWAGNYYGATPIANLGSNTLVKGNDVDMYLGLLAPAANPYVSGVVYQNTNMAMVDIYQGAYATTAGTAGTVAIALGSSATPATIMTVPIGGTTSSNAPQPLPTLTVLPGWYYSFTLTNTTLASAVVVGH